MPVAQRAPVPSSYQAPPPRNDFFSRVDDFWHRLTEGLELQQLWRQFVTEARTGYRLYSNELEKREAERIGPPPKHRWLHTTKEFFWAVLMKLSPPKRIALLVGLVLFILGDVSWNAGDARGSFNTRILGGVIILGLLVLEIADRVVMKRDLEIAREIQSWLVPSQPPTVPGLDIAFVTRPANTVAGDYYDVIRRSSDGKYLIAVADVAGKSMPAALLMATFQASLKTLSATTDSLVDLVCGVNRYACEHSIRGSRFTTAFVAEYDSATRALKYVNAGHNPPMLLRDGSITQLSAGGVPLGIVPEALYQTGEVQLLPRDLLAIYTDGVVEAENVAAQEFGEARLTACLRMAQNGSASDIIHQLMFNVEAFVQTAPQHDDITCVILKAVP